MVSQQIIDIIIKAEDKASSQAEKIKSKFNQVGSAVNKSMSNASNSTNRFNEQLSHSRESLSMVGMGAANATNMLQQMQLNPNFGSRLDRAKLSVSQMGYSLDSVKGKLMVFRTYGSSVWDSFKTKVRSTAQSLKTKFSSAIDNVKAKLKSLNAASKTAGGGLGFLRSAASMTVGMIGYDLVNGIMESGRSAINASSQLQYFGQRMKLSANQTAKFNEYLGDMQGKFRKVNMKAVGASAEEMAVKLKLPANSLRELTKTTAVMSSAFVKEGRTQEDAILAVSDAMDGQFRRLQELGISQDILKNNGWDGDLENKTDLLQAMNKTLDDMGFTKTAQDITSLDEAYQALTVAGGDLIASVLVPLTPLFLNISETIIGVIDVIKGFIGMLQGAWNALPDWAKYAVGIAAIALAVGLLVSYFGGLTGILISVASSFAPVIGAIMGISAPVVAVIAVIGLLIVAIYEVGKAFGWWSDVGSMITHIGAGIQRIWNAFINHPDVQAAIGWLVDGLKWVSDGVQFAIAQVSKFFGISSGSNWDIVSSIIHGIGDAWNGLRPYVAGAIGILQGAFSFLARLVGIAVGIGQGIYNGLRPIVCILLGCSPGIVPALQKVQEVFTTVWNVIVGFVSSVISRVVSGLQPVIDVLILIGEFIVGQFMESWNAFVEIVTIILGTVTQLVAIFQSFMDGQISLTTMLSMVWNTISTMFLMVINIIVQRVISFGSKLWDLALSIGGNFLRSLLSFFMQLPGRIYTYLMLVYNRIVTTGSKWVNTAKQKASQMIIGILNYLKQLPGKAYNYLYQVVSKIISAGKAWVDNAKKKAMEIVTGVVTKLSGLPGKVYAQVKGVKEKIVKPFKDAYNRIKQIVNDILSLNLSGLASDLSFAGEGVDLYGNIVQDGVVVGNINDTNSTSSNDAIDVNQNITLTLDLKNVPDSIDENRLISMLQDKKVLKALTGNSVFQELDSKMKTAIINKNNRARGV